MFHYWCCRCSCLFGLRKYGLKALAGNLLLMLWWLSLVVSIPATVLLGAMLVRRVKLVRWLRRVRDGVRGLVDEGRPVAALKHGVKHWSHGVLWGPAGEGAATVGEFLDGLDYADERELVGKI